VEDAARALDLLRDRADVRRVAFVGARLGALVAARVARAEPGAAVALWAPIPDPRTALEQAARARRGRDATSFGGPDPAAPVAPVPGATNGTGLPPPAGGGVGRWSPDLASSGSAGAASPRAPAADDLDAPIDVFDTPLASELAEGSAVRSLADELGRGPRPLLLAAVAAGQREMIAAGCRARGVSVEVLAHTYDDERDGTLVPGAPADELIDQTARWLTARLAAGTPAGGALGDEGQEVSERRE
jgi:hypothetical protein